MKKETRETIVRLIISAAVIGAIVGGIYLIMYLLGVTDLSQEELQAIIKEAGVIAPLIFIVISFLQVTFVPIPGAVTILAGNYVFGAWYSFLYSYIGMLAGALFAFALGRWIGRPFVNWIAGGKEKVDGWLQRLKGRENVLLFFMFFLPAFPDDILCSVAGILPIGWLGFTVMQVITRATSVGATLLFMSGEVIPFDEPWGIAVLALVGALAVLAFVISYRNAERINRSMEQIADRIVGRIRGKRK